MVNPIIRDSGEQRTDMLNKTYFEEQEKKQIKEQNLNTKLSDGRTLKQVMNDNNYTIEWQDQSMFIPESIKKKSELELLKNKYGDKLKFDGNEYYIEDTYSYRKDGSDKRKEETYKEKVWQFDSNGNKTKYEYSSPESYDNGFKRDKVQQTEFYENGQLVKRYEYSYDNGKRTDRVKYDYKTGKVKSKTYNNVKSGSQGYVQDTKKIAGKVYVGITDKATGEFIPDGSMSKEDLDRYQKDSKSLEQYSKIQSKTGEQYSYIRDPNSGNLMFSTNKNWLQEKSKSFNPIKKTNTTVSSFDVYKPEDSSAFSFAPSDAIGQNVDGSYITKNDNSNSAFFSAIGVKPKKSNTQSFNVLDTNNNQLGQISLSPSTFQVNQGTSVPEYANSNLLIGNLKTQDFKKEEEIKIDPIRAEALTSLEKNYPNEFKEFSEGKRKLVSNSQGSLGGVLENGDVINPTTTYTYSLEPVNYKGESEDNFKKSLESGNYMSIPRQPVSVSLTTESQISKPSVLGEFGSGFERGRHGQFVTSGEKTSLSYQLGTYLGNTPVGVLASLSEMSGTAGLGREGATEKLQSNFGFSEKEANRIVEATTFATGMVIGGGIAGAGSRAVGSTNTGAKVFNVVNKAMDTRTGKIIGWGTTGLGAVDVGVQGYQGYKEGGVSGALAYGGSSALEFGSIIHGFNQVVKGGLKGSQENAIKNVKENGLKIEVVKPTQSITERNINKNTFAEKTISSQQIKVDGKPYEIKDVTNTKGKLIENPQSQKVGNDELVEAFSTSSLSSTKVKTEKGKVIEEFVGGSFGKSGTLGDDIVISQESSVLRKVPKTTKTNEIITESVNNQYLAKLDNNIVSRTDSLSVSKIEKPIEEFNVMKSTSKDVKPFNERVITSEGTGTNIKTVSKDSTIDTKTGKLKQDTSYTETKQLYKENQFTKFQDEEIGYWVNGRNIKEGKIQSDKYIPTETIKEGYISTSSKISNEKLITPETQKLNEISGLIGSNQQQTSNIKKFVEVGKDIKTTSNTNPSTSSSNQKLEFEMKNPTTQSVLKSETPTTQTSKNNVNNALKQFVEVQKVNKIKEIKLTKTPNTGVVGGFGVGTSKVIKPFMGYNSTSRVTQEIKTEQTSKQDSSLMKKLQDITRTDTKQDKGNEVVTDNSQKIEQVIGFDTGQQFEELFKPKLTEDYINTTPNKTPSGVKVPWKGRGLGGLNFPSFGNRLSGLNNGKGIIAGVKKNPIKDISNTMGSRFNKSKVKRLI